MNKKTGKWYEDGKKTGLVLEGGGMRGVFTSGVLDAFMKHDLYFPYTVAVSAGACNGMSYISRQPVVPVFPISITWIGMNISVFGIWLLKVASSTAGCFMINFPTSCCLSILILFPACGRF